MELPQSVVAAIESAHVAFEGLSHPLKVVSVDRGPTMPGGRSGLAVTVETTHNGAQNRGVCTFSDDDLETPPRVVDTFATAMRASLLEGLHPKDEGEP